MKVIDADGVVLGRLSSETAKMLLKGEKVIVINAENAIISGAKNDIFGRYKQRADRADLANPRKGPKFPRRPDMLVKRTIRGMLPKTSRGRSLLKNLKVFMGEPSEYKNAEKINIRKPGGKSVRISELSQFLGWKNPIKGDKK